MEIIQTETQRLKKKKKKSGKKITQKRSLKSFGTYTSNGLIYMKFES